MNTNFPKDYDQIIITIDGVNVSGIVGQTEIYQDIFAPMWSCSVVFMDTQNQLMNLPIKPGSEIEILLETNAPKPCQGKHTFNFVAFKISERELVKQDTYTYIVHGISKEYFDDQRKRVSKYYGGTADSIAKKIIDDSGIGKITDTSSGSDVYDVIVPNLSPFAAVEWLTLFAKTSSAGADYCFYQLDDGKYAFTSLEDMFNDKSDLTLKQVIPNIKKNSEEQVDAYVSIGQFRVINQIDALPNFEMGFFGSKTVSHDIINKKFTESEFKYGDDLAVDKTYAPFSGDVFDEAGNSNISFVPVHPEISEKGVVSNETHDTWKGSRKSSVMKLETNRLIVDIPGHACLYDQLGRTIQVEMPSHQDVTTDRHDEYMKGDYLVTAIRHIIAKEYTIFMELSKKRMSKRY